MLWSLGETSKCSCYHPASPLLCHPTMPPCYPATLPPRWRSCYSLQSCLIITWHLELVPASFEKGGRYAYTDGHILSHLLLATCNPTTLLKKPKRSGTYPSDHVLHTAHASSQIMTLGDGAFRVSSKAKARMEITASQGASSASSIRAGQPPPGVESPARILTLSPAPPPPRKLQVMRGSEGIWDREEQSFLI